MVLQEAPDWAALRHHAPCCPHMLCPQSAAAVPPPTCRLRRKKKTRNAIGGCLIYEARCKRTVQVKSSQVYSHDESAIILSSHSNAPPSSLLAMAWFSQPLWLPARIIIVRELAEWPSGTAIISLSPVTLALSVIGWELTFQLLPPSEDQAEPPPHAMTTSLPIILGHALPHLTPLGWLALTSADQVDPSSCDSVSKTEPLERLYRSATVELSRMNAPG